MSLVNAASDVPNSPEQVRQLGRFVAVVVPAADVRKRDLDADVGLDEPCDLLQALPNSP